MAHHSTIPADTIPATLDPSLAPSCPAIELHASLAAPRLPSFGTMGDYDYLFAPESTYDLDNTEENTTEFEVSNA